MIFKYYEIEACKDFTHLLTSLLETSTDLEILIIFILSFKAFISLYLSSNSNDNLDNISLNTLKIYFQNLLIFLFHYLF